MRALFVNTPFVKHDSAGRTRTGPNAGSRWPWTEQGITEYACFPFFMAYAVRYLELHGIDADFYDAVARKHWDYQVVRRTIAAATPEIIFFETSTPLYRTIAELATWAKEQLGARVVLVGPHVHTFAEQLLHEPFVDHCVVGEYEQPALEIARDPKNAKKLYTFKHLEDINRIAGTNFTPHRPLEHLFSYWDPSMQTARVQLQVNTSRGCPFKCTYCQWPKVMNNGTYRAREPELVIEEIREVVQQYRENYRSGTFRLRGTVREIAALRNGYQSLTRTIKNSRTRWKGEIGSIFFDDDTWNLGPRRVSELCRGLKDLGLPWTMMGRIDTTSLQLYDLMVECGCVGMRFGIESFNQRLLDNTKKRLDARVSLENVRYLLTRYSNLEFHFTTMKNLPGESEEDWRQDEILLKELRTLGEKSGNRVHWQNSDCVAFPGTELWDELVELGKGEKLLDFDLYDGNPSNDTDLAQSIGWLGRDYQPTWSKYSKHGQPNDLPEE